MTHQLGPEGYPLPPNEEERLNEVLNYTFSDGSVSESLEQICVLAQGLFNVPAALVVLLGREEQTFAAKVGVDIDGSARREAFCNWTVLADDVLVVPDASRDPRYCDNPFVTGPFGVRFYAGAPLIVSPGIRIGTLCVIDTHPRGFTAEDVERLAALATMTVNELRRWRAMIDIRRQRDLLSQVARMTRIGSWELDIETGRFVSSDGVRQVFEIDADFSPAPRDLRRFLRGETRHILKALRRLISDAEPFDEEIPIVASGGAHKWVRCIAEAEMSGDKVSRLIGSVQDVTEQHNHALEIERLAYSDTLTGLPNRMCFQNDLTAALAAADPRQSRVGLVMIDLDHFKDVNDLLGHDAGDALLCLVANRLTQIFGVNQTVARLGGDEFAIVVPDVASSDDVAGPTEIILELLRHPVHHRGKRLSITASAGISFFPDHGRAPGELLKNADIALYKAKDTGRNRAVMFDPAMRREVEARAELLCETKAALEAGEFVLFYQPIVSVGQPRQVVGFEALLRWRHSDRGILTPEHFWGALEDQETSLMLGEMALDSAVSQMREWADRGVDFGRLAVNTSASQFRTGGFAEFVRAKLKQWQVAADRLVLEVTENIYLGWSADVVLETIAALHRQGVLIALDDFGTGYASLSHLRQFPINYLKIDKAFLQGENSTPMLRAIMALGRSMDIKVIAEGVEDPEQLAFLDSIGCDKAQGYLFARPMPAAEVPDFLKTFNKASRNKAAARWVA